MRSKIISEPRLLRSDHRTIKSRGRSLTRAALIKFISCLSFSSLSTTVFADQVYCPSGQHYIQTGMTEAEVLNACGHPLSINETNETPTAKVPITQLIYTSLNQGSVYPGLNDAFYNQWSLPSGSTGISLQFDIRNNKVISIKMNGSDTNATTLCGGRSVQVGDPPSAIYNACGSPGYTNQTYINQPIPTTTKPKVWIYRQDQYQPAIHLLFVNGQLMMIQ